MTGKTMKQVTKAQRERYSNWRYGDDRGGKDFTDAQFDRSVRAVAAFRKQLPTLRSYARALIGRPIAIQAIAKGAYTDGTTLFLSPPIELGDEHIHERHLCDKRSIGGQLLCDACAVHEAVMASIYHEMAHVIFDTTLAISPARAQTFISTFLANVEATPKQTAHLKEIVKTLKTTAPKDIPPHMLAPMGIANSTVPPMSAEERKALIEAKQPMPRVWAGHLLNVIEDCRVNERMFRAREGIRIMRQEYAKALAAQPMMEDPETGQDLYLSDLDHDLQLGFAVYYRLHQYEDLMEPICEEVLTVLDDPEVSDLLDVMPFDGTVSESWTYVTRMLARFNELGFMTYEDPEEEEGGGDGDGESADGGDGEGDGQGSPGNGSDPGRGDQRDGAEGSGKAQGGADPSDGDGGAGSQPDAAGPPESGQGVPDPAQHQHGHDDGSGFKLCGIDLRNAKQVEASAESGPAQGEEGDADAVALTAALNQAIEQGAWFMTPSTTITGTTIIREGDEDFRGHQRPYIQQQGQAGETLGIEERYLGGPLLRLRRLFEANKTAKHQRNLKSGKVNSRVLGKRILVEDERLFRRKKMPDKRDYEVFLGLDMSGSTASMGNGLIEMKVGMAIGELLHRLGVKFSIWGHTSISHLFVFALKEPNEPWDGKRKERFKMMGAQSGNIDGHALEFLRKQADASAARVKIIMYSSDGAMPAENYNEELEILQREIAICKKKGYVLIGVGINSDSPTEHGLDTVELHGVEDVGLVVRHLEKHMKGINA